MNCLLICEGPGDEDDLKTLAQRVAGSVVPADGPPTSVLPKWAEYEPGRGFLRWVDIDTVCHGHAIPQVHGLGTGLGFRAAKRSLNLLLKVLNVEQRRGLRVVMVHDSDHRPGWRESLARARDAWLGEQKGADRRSDIRVAVGVADPEHEAWLIATFVPTSGEERQRLADVRRDLGFDPTLYPERLTSGRETHPKDAKRVLRVLLGDDRDRRGGLLRDTSLDEITTKGRGCGLSEFVAELAAAFAVGAGP